ncbi:MAG TPA: DUF1080 domain-containing protein [Pirellulales bacterium]|jgi:hypothetical protein|nr:DUF1080 domain-containing protein [Pirellulales bacterium]
MTSWMESWITKVAAGLFATVMAPFLVAIGLKYSDTILPPSDTAAAVTSATASISSATDAAKADSTPNTSNAADSSNADSNLSLNSNSKIVRLFNGRDLAGFSTWLGPAKKGGKPLGANNDPKHVFQAVDGQLRISGEIEGFVMTRQFYDNYALTVEYRWGDKTWGDRQDKTRTSGVLLHLLGKPSDAKNRHAIKCQIKEGATGDFVIFGEQHDGVPSLTVEADQREFDKGERHVVLLSYRPGSPLTTISTGFVARTHRDSRWQDVKGFRGSEELERPAGEWNLLECICKGGTITTRLNGETVNVGTAARPNRGRIAFQSAGAEIFFRHIELRPLD